MKTVGHGKTATWVYLALEFVERDLKAAKEVRAPANRAFTKMEVI